MIFVINKYSIEGGGGVAGVWFCLCVCKFLFPIIRLDDKTGWCKEITGMLGNVRNLKKVRNGFKSFV
jgi:hypothetical protein